MNWDSVVERVGVGMWCVMDFTGVIGEGLSEGAMFELILSDKKAALQHFGRGDFK